MAPLQRCSWPVLLVIVLHVQELRVLCSKTSTPSQPVDLTSSLTQGTHPAASSSACTATDSASFIELTKEGGCAAIRLATESISIGDPSPALDAAVHLTPASVVTALAGAEVDLTASGPIHITGPLDVPPSQHSLRFEAGGSFSVSSSGSVQTQAESTDAEAPGGDLGIEASRFEIKGPLKAGGRLSFTGGGGKLRVGKGAEDTAESPAISEEELSRMSSGKGLQLGGEGTVRIEITGGLSEASTSGIQGTVEMVAGNTAGKIIFQGGEAAFRALTAEADGGLELWSDVTTHVGDLKLDGNMHGSFFKTRMTELLQGNVNATKEKIAALQAQMGEPGADGAALMSTAKDLSKSLLMHEMSLKDIGGDTMRRVAKRAQEEASLAKEELETADAGARIEARNLEDGEAPLRVRDTYLRGVVQAALEGVKQAQHMVEVPAYYIISHII